MRIEIEREFNLQVGSVIITDWEVYMVCANHRDGDLYLLSLENSSLCDQTFDHFDEIIKYLKKDEGETIEGIVPPTECTLTI